MAKKRKKGSRSQRKRKRGPRLSPTQLVQPTAGRPTAVGAQSTTQPSSAGRVAGQMPDLREEYHYVVADLKRIAIIAAVMMVVMIGLAFLAV